MKFIGTPNLLIRVNKNMQRTRNMKHFRFDSDGFYETESPRLIRLLSRRFKTAEENNIVVENINEEIISEPEVEIPMAETVKKTLKCKKCGYETSNQGELLSHYRSEHPKKG